MRLLNFEKNDLVNLEYSLHREILSTNRAGAYMSTTVIGCNTRKYHGLFVCPIDDLDGENYVLLSNINETVIQHDQRFNLGTFRYPGVYEPKGYKYIKSFDCEPTPTTVYRVGGVLLQKELLMMHNKDQLMIRYTLLEAHSPTKLQLNPFFAFRSRHKLSKENLFAKTDYIELDNGISTHMYENFPKLNVQLNKANKFVHQANWYYNVEYLEEKARGYDFQEDLLSLGHFEVALKKGESIIFSASLQEERPRDLTKAFDDELSIRRTKDSFENCMKHAATQFVVRRGKDTEIVAGYPWFGRWGRDTFIALPGLTLAGNYDPKTCKDVLDTMSNEMHNGLFPNIGKDDKAAYNSVDAPMWYFWAIQQYVADQKDSKTVWQAYGEKMKSILYSYRYGVNEHIGMHDNGLIWAKEHGKGLTWMDAVVHESPVTQRGGYVVEINALWYNAILFVLELAKEHKDKKFVEEWKDLPQIIKTSFNSTFWNDTHKYLADYVDENGQNMDLRSNQVIATSLEYCPIDDIKKEKILKIIKHELLTPKGLRTLSPNHPDYKGIYQGDQPTRDRAYHQGTVWVWQLGHYVEGRFKLHGALYCDEAKKLLNSFSEDLDNYGVGSIAEVYDGNPHHHPGGSISQAWSVSEILRIMKMIERYKLKK